MTIFLYMESSEIEGNIVINIWVMFIKHIFISG